MSNLTINDLIKVLQMLPEDLRNNSISSIGATVNTNESETCTHCYQFELSSENSIHKICVPERKEELQKLLELWQSFITEETEKQITNYINSESAFHTKFDSKVKAMDLFTAEKVIAEESTIKTSQFYLEKFNAVCQECREAKRKENPASSCLCAWRSFDSEFCPEIVEKYNKYVEALQAKCDTKLGKQFVKELVSVEFYEEDGRQWVYICPVGDTGVNLEIRTFEDLSVAFLYYLLDKFSD